MASRSPKYVTASLRVDFRRPTPHGPELHLNARPIEIGARKVIVDVSVTADGVECVQAQVVAVAAPAIMRARP